MKATKLELLDHVPPGSISLSVVLDPKQIVENPDIGSGSGFTVTVIYALHPVDASV
jgi:hypothetical protein